MPIQLILNADDFGASPAVNSAVVQARRHGLLTSASLMVTGQSAREAVSIANDDPSLAVGLHLALSDASSALPHSVIPALTANDSRFTANPAIAALRYYVSSKARRELRLEIAAQFEAFADTGMSLSHVDGHQHLHAHPAVLPHVIVFAAKYGAAGIRMPRDPFRANLRTDRSHLGSKLVTAVGHAYLSSVCKRLLCGSDLACCDICIGSLMSGTMSDSYVIAMLEEIDRGSVEVFFHPTDGESAPDRYGPNSGDLRALTSPRLKQFIADHDFDLTNYVSLRRTRAEVARERG